jgi:hypothetical protein
VTGVARTIPPELWGGKKELEPSAGSVIPSADASSREAVSSS